MPPGNRLALLIPLVALVACSPRPEPSVTSSAPAATPAPDTTSPAAAVTAAEPGAHHNDPTVINFVGFGPATFGSDEEHVRMAWGRPLESGKSAEGSTCHFLAMDPPPENGRGIRFMMEDGKFVRYDVDVPIHVAPGGIAVGDDMDAVRKAFPGRIDDQPHKYVEGARNLVVSGPEGARAKLVFETDAAGKITRWRIGVPPQVYYVEGCG
jgi:hypothetical protein